MSVLNRPYKILIGTTIGGYTATPAGSAVGSIQDGEIAVVGPDMTVITNGDTISDQEYIYLVQGTSGAPIFSAKIVGSGVTNWNGDSYSAAVQQVSFVGYDGSTGNIEATTGVLANTEYSFRVLFKQDKTIFSERQSVREYRYKTNATDAREEVVDGLLAQIALDEQFNKQAVAAKVGSGATVGISITGIDLGINPKLDVYELVSFEVVLGDGFTSETTLFEQGAGNSVVGDRGVGTYNLIADLEFFGNGYRGQTNRTKHPVLEPTQYVSTSGTYDLYVIEHFDRHASANLESNVDSPLMSLVAIPVGFTGLTANVEAALNPYMASTPKAFPAVNL